VADLAPFCRAISHLFGESGRCTDRLIPGPSAPVVGAAQPSGPGRRRAEGLVSALEPASSGLLRAMPSSPGW